MLFTCSILSIISLSVSTVRTDILNFQATIYWHRAYVRGTSIRVHSSLIIWVVRNVNCIILLCLSNNRDQISSVWQTLLQCTSDTMFFCILICQWGNKHSTVPGCNEDTGYDYTYPFADILLQLILSYPEFISIYAAALLYPWHPAVYLCYTTDSANVLKLITR